MQFDNERNMTTAVAIEAMTQLETSLPIRSKFYFNFKLNLT